MSNPTPDKPMLYLAPMQGIVDAPLRNSLSALGGIDGCVSVYARVGQQPLPSRALVKQCPEMAYRSSTGNESANGRTRCGVPVALQLMGGSADSMAATARTAVKAGATSIDINFGCPDTLVNNHDAGARLLCDPHRITRIIRAIRCAIPTNIPISAKLRAGWSSISEAPALAEAAEQGGATTITMHGRTRFQRYEGRASWEAIGRARKRVSIPVVANGDIRSPEDLALCAEISGCKRFMIGRGAIARPELFRVLSHIQETFWTPTERIIWLCDFGDSCFAENVESNTTGHIKGILRYMSETSPAIATAFKNQRHHIQWPTFRDGLLLEAAKWR